MVSITGKVPRVKWEGEGEVRTLPEEVSRPAQAGGPTDADLGTRELQGLTRGRTGSGGRAGVQPVGPEFPQSPPSLFLTGLPASPPLLDAPHSVPFFSVFSVPLSSLAHSSPRLG